MFFTRLISGVILLIIMIAAMILGGDVLFFITALLAFIGLYELYKTYNIHKNMLGYAGMAGAVIYGAMVRFALFAGDEGQQLPMAAPHCGISADHVCLCVYFSPV